MKVAAKVSQLVAQDKSDSRLDNGQEYDRATTERREGMRYGKPVVWLMWVSVTPTCPNY